MNWPRILLFVNAVSFVGYGVACLSSPALPAGYAGFDVGDASGRVEIMAMYGGLQAAFGVLLLYGAFAESQRGGALLALGIVLAGLASARLLGMALYGTSPYNLGAFGYEATMATLAFLALRLRAHAPAASN